MKNIIIKYRRKNITQKFNKSMDQLELLVNISKKIYDSENVKSKIHFIKDRPGHDRRYAIDASKLERELGWKPKETFETGLRKTVLWFLENEIWVKNVLSGEYQHWIQKQYS